MRICIQYIYIYKHALYIVYKHVCNHHNQSGYLGLSPHNFGQYPLNPMPLNPMPERLCNRPWNGHLLFTAWYFIELNVKSSVVVVVVVVLVHISFAPNMMDIWTICCKHCVFSVPKRVVILTEFLWNISTGADSTGQFFELFTIQAPIPYYWCMFE